MIEFTDREGKISIGEWSLKDLNSLVENPYQYIFCHRAENTELKEINDKTNLLVLWLEITKDQEEHWFYRAKEHTNRDQLIAEAMIAGSALQKVVPRVVTFERRKGEWHVLQDLQQHYISL